MNEFSDESGKLPKTLQDLRDNAIEEATDGNGPKIARFDAKRREERQRNEEKRKAEAQRMSAFQSMLLNDPEYRALYERVSILIEDIQSKLDQAILDNAAEIELMEASAMRLEDGTMVFQAADGTVYTQDGQIVPESEHPTSFPNEAPSWENYQAARLRRVELATIQTSTIDAAREELRNQRDGPNEQRLEDVEKNLNGALHDIENKADRDGDATLAAQPTEQALATSLDGLFTPKPV